MGYWKAGDREKELMTRFGGRGQSMTLCQSYTPKLNLNMGMDSNGHSTPPVTGPDFNNDFSNDFGPPA